MQNCMHPEAAFLLYIYGVAACADGSNVEISIVYVVEIQRNENIDAASLCDSLVGARVKIVHTCIHIYSLVYLDGIDPAGAYQKQLSAA